MPLDSGIKIGAPEGWHLQKFLQIQPTHAYNHSFLTLAIYASALTETEFEHQRKPCY